MLLLENIMKSSSRLVKLILIIHYVLHADGVLPVSKTKQKIIVDAHNAFRRNFAPNATNMMKMTWDDGLAEQAMKHADRYVLEHDQHHERYADNLPGVVTGQNMCFGRAFKTWNDCLNSWFSEGSTFEYGTGSKTGNPYDIIHVTQVLFWKTSRVGCAVTTCNCYSYYVCNYAYSLIWEEFETPWTEGVPCGACPDSCDDGLCECGGKMCMNDGTLDLLRCQCTCKNHPNSAFSGDQCETLNCDVPSPRGCNYYSQDLAETYCRDYSNLRNDCPHYCGRCSP